MVSGEFHRSASATVMLPEEQIIRGIESVLFDGDTLANRIRIATHGRLASQLEDPAFPEQTEPVQNRETENLSIYGF
jgi:hypothetical protein